MLPAIGATLADDGAQPYLSCLFEPEPPKPITWNVYKIASKAVWLGEVEAPDEATAMEKGAAAGKLPATRLMALRRAEIRSKVLRQAQQTRRRAPGAVVRQV
jgi:hypothetical protein